MAISLAGFRDRFTSRIPAIQPGNSSFKWWVLATIMISTFMAVLDATIVNVALAKLTVAFGTSTDLVAWVLTGYMLVFAVMLPASGWFADRFGYRATYMAGIFLFTLGSLLCSLSWNIFSLIAFRIIQGAGGGLLQPVGMAIITREFPPEKRGVALGFWAIASSASVSIGPTLGGYLIDNFNWQTIFDVNVPVGILGLAMAFFILREHKLEEIPRFDLPGFLSLSIFLGGLLLGLSEGNAAWNTDGWSSSFILTCFGVSAAGLVVYVLSALYTQRPLIDLKLFKDRDFGLSNVVLFVFGLGMFGSTFLLPLYLQNALGYTPLQAGLIFLPMGLLTAAFAPLSGMLTDRVGSRIPLAIGLSLMAISMYQYRSLSVLSESASIMLPLYIRGIGMAFIFTPLSSVAISHIDPKKMARASGIINVVRQIGGSFGVALFGTMLIRQQAIYSNTFGQAMDRYSAAFNHAMAGLTTFAIRATGGTVSTGASKAQALLIANMYTQSFVAAIGRIFLVASIVIAVALVPVLLLKESHRKRTKHAGSASAE